MKYIYLGLAFELTAMFLGILNIEMFAVKSMIIFYLNWVIIVSGLIFVIIGMRSGSER